MNTFETNGKIENLSKEIKYPKKNEMKTLELKNAIIGLKSRTERTEKDLGNLKMEQKMSNLNNKEKIE